MANLMFNVNNEDFKTPVEFMPSYLGKKDSRMRFNNSRDPIYYAFELLEKRSVVDLVSDFIEDSFYEVSNFVSKVVK